MFDPLTLVGMGADPLINVLAKNPAVAQGIGGHTAGMLGSVAPIFSILDAPGRAVRGGLMSAAGGTKTAEDGSVSTASFLPAVAGLAAGGLSALVPGLGAMAPWIGTATAGLAQQLGEAFAPDQVAAFSASDLNNALGVPSNFASDLLTGAVTDPLTWAGGLSQLAKPKAPALAPVMGPPLPADVLADRIAAAGRVPAASAVDDLAHLHVGGARPDAAAADLIDAWRPPAGDGLARVLGSNPEAAFAAGDDAADLTYSLSRAAAPGPIAPPGAALAPSHAVSPGWLDRANEASLAGYRPDLQAMMPDFLSPLGKTYQRVNPAAGGPLAELGYMTPGAGKSGTMNYHLPPWAEVRGGNVMPSKSMALPDLPADPLGYMNDAGGARTAIDAGVGAAMGRPDPLSPLQRFLQLRQGTGLGNLRA